MRYNIIRPKFTWYQIPLLCLHVFLLIVFYSERLILAVNPKAQPSAAQHLNRNGCLLAQLHHLSMTFRKTFFNHSSSNHPSQKLYYIFTCWTLTQFALCMNCILQPHCDSITMSANLFTRILFFG